MGASKDLFIKLSEEEYMAIPEDVREAHLRHKIYSESINDYEELMKDEAYRSFSETYKAAKQYRDERAYYLREQKRKNKN